MSKLSDKEACLLRKRKKLMLYYLNFIGSWKSALKKDFTEEYEDILKERNFSYKELRKKFDIVINDCEKKEKSLSKEKKIIKKYNTLDNIKKINENKFRLGIIDQRLDNLEVRYYGCKKKITQQYDEEIASLDKEYREKLSFVKRVEKQILLRNFIERQHN